MASSTSSSSSSGGPLGHGLVIGTAMGATVVGTFSQGDDQILRLVSSQDPPCKFSAPPFARETYYAYVEVSNPNPMPASVEIGVDPAPGQNLYLPLMAAYSSLPVTQLQRAACLTGADLGCLFGTMPHESCLTGDFAPIIPAGGSIWVYVGNFDTTDPSVSFIMSAKILAF